MTPHEIRRYVFASAGPGLRELATTIVQPRIVLRLCDTAASLRALLPARWRLDESYWFMQLAAPGPAFRPLAAGYGLECSVRDGAWFAHVRAPDGSTAASGYAAVSHGFAAYDRIVTEPAHQRRGLGAAVMHALGERVGLPAERHVLVATVEGRALYERLGWLVRSEYAGAHVPDPAEVA